MSDIKIYRCFHDSSDNELWAKYDGRQIHTLLKHGFGLDDKLGGYLEKKFNVAKTILYDFDKTYLNVQNVKFPNGFSFDSDPNEYKTSKNDRRSKGNLTHKLFREINNGKGWAVLIEKHNDEIKLIDEGYWDNVLEYITEDYLKGKGIDFDTFEVENFNKFSPKISHFKK